MTHPWLHDFPTVTCSLHSKNLFQTKRFKSNAVGSNQFDCRVFLAEANKSASIIIALLVIPYLTKPRGGLELGLVFELISFNLPIQKISIPRNLSPHLE